MYCTRCGRWLEAGTDRCDGCGSAVGIRATTPTVVVREGTPGDGPWRSRALLVLRHDPRATAVVPVNGELRIGHGDEADLFLDDISVSRCHALVAARNDVYVIRDLGSVNGTYVNGRRIEEAILSTGDEIRVGRFRLTFMIRRPS